MQYRNTEAHNHSSNPLTYDSDSENPVILHSASKYTKRIAKVESKKVKVLRNSLKI